MGKRMKKRWELPSEQAGTWLVLCAFFFCGGIVGCLFAGCSDGAGAQELSSYLSDYLTLIQDGAVTQSFMAVFWRRLRDFALILLFGTAVIGVVGVPVLFAAQGFLFSFSVGCFCRVFGWRGLVPAFSLFGLPALLWVPALFLAGMCGLTRARMLLNSGRTGWDSASGRAGYWCQMGFCFLIALLAVLLEYFVVPALLRGTARFVLQL